MAFYFLTLNNNNTKIILQKVIMNFTKLFLLLTLAFSVSSCQSCSLRSKTNETNPRQTHPQQHHHQQHHKPVPMAELNLLPLKSDFPETIKQEFHHE